VDICKTPGSCRRTHTRVRQRTRRLLGSTDMPGFLGRDRR